MKQATAGWQPGTSWIWPQYKPMTHAKLNLQLIHDGDLSRFGAKNELQFQHSIYTKCYSEAFHVISTTLRATWHHEAGIAGQISLWYRYSVMFENLEAHAITQWVGQIFRAPLTSLCPPPFLLLRHHKIVACKWCAGKATGHTATGNETSEEGVGGIGVNIR